MEAKTFSFSSSSSNAILVTIFILFLLCNSVYSSPTDFIKASCGSTRYPELCVECLSSYASSINQDPHRLAQTALSVSYTRARSASVFVSELHATRGLSPRCAAAIKDCVSNVQDSVDRLRQSMAEFHLIGGAATNDFAWHMSNVQTWVSAALTDENTCIDGFSVKGIDPHIKAQVRSKIINVAQVTSNALALVNRVASRHHL